MQIFVSIIVGLLLLAVSGCWKERSLEIKELELVAALSIQTEDLVELSGLTIFGGDLYVIADKHDDRIFKIRKDEDRAWLEIHRRFTPPVRGEMDWEGITVDRQGNFYLASESHSRMARLGVGESKATWVSGDLRSSKANEAELLQKTNAGLEGIVWLSENHWLLAAEREPRGLIEYRIFDGDPWISAYSMDITRFGSELSLLRLPDFSGLAYHDGQVYGLFRNAHLVVPLQKGRKGYVEGNEAFSYKGVETDPMYRYSDTRFGQMEGLAIDSDYIYIVVDNNRTARFMDETDRRPQLFIYRKP